MARQTAMTPFDPTLTQVAIYTIIATLALTAISIAIALVLGSLHAAATIGLSSV